MTTKTKFQRAINAAYNTFGYALLSGAIFSIASPDNVEKRIAQIKVPEKPAIIQKKDMAGEHARNLVSQYDSLVKLTAAPYNSENMNSLYAEKRENLIPELSRLEKEIKLVEQDIATFESSKGAKIYDLQMKNYSAEKLDVKENSLLRSRIYVNTMVASTTGLFGTYLLEKFFLLASLLSKKESKEGEQK